MMRQRAFLLFLISVILTSLCVVLLPGRRRSRLHSLVRETQERISALGEELIPDSEELSSPSLVADPTHLSSLGLEGPGLPVLYPEGPWLAQGRATDPCLVTGVEPGQGEVGLGLIKSAHHFLPATSLLVFDLGLAKYDRDRLEKHCNSTTCALHTFDFAPWPSHLRTLHLRAYRPLIIQTVLRDVGSVVWLDPDHRLTTSNLSQWLAAAKKEGVVVWQQGEATATTALTHPRMFEFFPGVKYEEYAFQHMASASVVVLVYTQATHSKLMLPWLRCALTESCINPIGAQDSGCRFDKKPQYRYSGCHRYDVSALNLVLGSMFHFSEDRYMRRSGDSFFRRVTQAAAAASSDNTTQSHTDP